jgi:hypothetical protein
VLKIHARLQDAASDIQDIVEVAQLDEISELQLNVALQLIESITEELRLVLQIRSE